jgi:TPP-dependent pyruvate/acetoin dehydrogenase alpha subunit
MLAMADSPHNALMQTLLRSPFNEAREDRGWNVEAVLRDYRVAFRSRQCTIIGRREVFSGKAKFGIFGDGKEIAQLALAYAFRKGDFRSGYYRDQTLMFALDLLTPEQFFAQLYAHADVKAEPGFGGRSMTGHFATRLLDDAGNFLPQVDRYNSAADLSPTASQMPRLVGLAYARNSIGNHRTSQHTPHSSHQKATRSFSVRSAMPAAPKVFSGSPSTPSVYSRFPLLLSVWDDGFGISVPNAFQMTKGDISRILEGFKHRVGGRPGINIYVAKGWDFPGLCSTYIEASDLARQTHTPAIIHVTELTQPFGHSTSGNHERYKSEDRLAWEREFDCLLKMREWILESGFATPQALDQIEADEERVVLDARARAWEAYRTPIDEERKTALSLMEPLATSSPVVQALREMEAPLRRDILAAATEVLLDSRTRPPKKLPRCVSGHTIRKKHTVDTTALISTASQNSLR